MAADRWNWLLHHGEPCRSACTHVLAGRDRQGNRYTALGLANVLTEAERRLGRKRLAQRLAG